MKIAITGGSGFIGTEITKKLIELGHKVVIISKEKPVFSNVEFIRLDLKNEIENKDIFKNIDAVINLTGVNIFGRWNKKLKKEIYDSRIITTRNLIKAINNFNNNIKVFISASALGFYGDKEEEEEVYENSEPGNDFLSKVCIDWENEVKNIKPSIRLAILRTAPVLDKDRGFLNKLLKFYKLKINPIFGSGQQWLPWIHKDDIVGMYIFALTNENLNGIYNACSSQQIRYEKFAMTLAELLNSKINIKLPEWLLKLFLGELAAIILSSQKVSSQKIIKEGYNFKFPDIKESLEDILKK
jgi:uncharacterized protein (TIGR01777 family)